MHAKGRHGDGAIELSRWTRHGDEIKEYLRSKGVVPQEPDDEHHDSHHHDDDEQPDD